MNQFNQAAAYEDNSSMQREEGLKLIDLLAPSAGYSILDLGCGTGYLTKVLATIKARYVLSWFQDCYLSYYLEGNFNKKLFQCHFMSLIIKNSS